MEKPKKKKGATQGPESGSQYRTKQGNIVNSVGRNLKIPAELYKTIGEENFIYNRNAPINENLEQTMLRLINAGCVATKLVRDGKLSAELFDDK